MRILVVSGASGGHIFPALSFLDALKNRDKDLDTLLVVPKRSLKNGLVLNGYNVRYISIAAIKLSLEFKNLIAIWKFFKGALESLILFLEFKPDMVVGFGSLVSVPLILFAWIFRAKTLIHEQNFIPGQANRLLAKFSDRIAISFLETKNYLGSSSDRIALTGNPLRKELKPMNKNTALDFWGLSYDKFTLLVMGGSLGSHKINQAIFEALSTLSDKSKLQVIHLTGSKDYDLLNSSYQKLNITSKLSNFLKEMHYGYSACDLVISRAGATTITEIITFKLPAIIVPYPFAYKHQLSNAKFLESRGCAIIIEDDKLDSAILRNILEDLMNNPDKLKEMRYNYNNIAQLQADELLVKEVMALN